mmetsp:Transcript_14684/g.50123  ORF Transcript_14684/g.50123 Transcript_14684/m.50123 type:complete len:400 (+) Transcript_14684:1886-3085(+)
MPVLGLLGQLQKLSERSAEVAGELEDAYARVSSCHRQLPVARQAAGEQDAVEGDGLHDKLLLLVPHHNLPRRRLRILVVAQQGVSWAVVVDSQAGSLLGGGRCRLEVPELEGGVLGDADHDGGGEVEVERVDLVRVLAEPLEPEPCVGLPQADHSLAAARRDLGAVGRDSQTRDGSGVSSEGAEELVLVEGPEDDRVIGSAGEEVEMVGGEGGAGDGAAAELLLEHLAHSSRVGPALPAPREDVSQVKRLLGGLLRLEEGAEGGGERVLLHVKLSLPAPHREVLRRAHHPPLVRHEAAAVNCSLMPFKHHLLLYPLSVLPPSPQHKLPVLPPRHHKTSVLRAVDRPDSPDVGGSDLPAAPLLHLQQVHACFLPARQQQLVVWGPSDPADRQVRGTELAD